MKHFVLPLFFFFVVAVCHAQPPATNYDESKIPAYTLPDLLLTDKGKRITTAAEWEQSRRPHILKMFTENVYGPIPARTSALHFKVIETDSTALGNTAIRKQVRIYFLEGENGPFMNVLLYLPKTKKSVPVFVGLNFNGNHTVNGDKAIIPAQYQKGPDAETERGNQSGRWQAEMIVSRGYGIATAHYFDLEPDDKEGWKRGIRSSLAKALNRKPEEWSAIGAWSWGLSRIQDYLETDPAVNAQKTILIGHSRLGKTALWAGANDKRFTKVISNNSGEGGAALSKRLFGETILNLNTSFPHWFINKYKSYNNNAASLPVDQHMLLALIAPRPLYVASAEEDQWADPKGEYLATKNALPAYKLYGVNVAGIDEMPAINVSGGNIVRYHIRSGKHDVTEFDWKQYLNFADATP